MGNYCSFCKDQSSSKAFEVEDQKRERIKLNSALNHSQSISLRSISYHSPSSGNTQSLCRSAKRYLAQKYLQITLYFYHTPYTLQYSPIPQIPEENPSKASNAHLYKSSPFLKVLPSIQLSSKDLYEGQWNLETLKPEGFGVLYEKDRGKYFGNFVAGLKHGTGRYISNKGIYEGEFQKNKAEGKGVLLKENGLIYAGQFRDGKEHGYGVIELNGEELYVGGFQEGCKHGKGKIKINEGSYYTGEFEKDSMHGQGVYIWSDGKKYEGEWKDGVIHGQGKYSWPDGSEYCGCYTEGNRDGFGVFRWPDGREYKGQWKLGVMHGSGCLSYYSKDTAKVVRGVWENGKKVK